jgi:membrane protein implicated in regulation of membrane protease activity
LQATIIPIALVLLGVLAITMPAHHVFYGVIALAVAIYSLVGINLGGFLIGMVLACIGGVLVTAWMPRRAAPPAPPVSEDEEGAPHEEVAR